MCAISGTARFSPAALLILFDSIGISKLSLEFRRRPPGPVRLRSASSMASPLLKLDPGFNVVRKA
jgi:hypothetical protein